MKEWIFTAVLFLGYGAGLAGVWYHAGFRTGYHDGTIDAMTGHPGYVLTTQPTGETVWVKK